MVNVLAVAWGTVTLLGCALTLCGMFAGPLIEGDNPGNVTGKVEVWLTKQCNNGDCVSGNSEVTLLNAATGLLVFGIMPILLVAVAVLYAGSSGFRSIRPSIVAMAISLTMCLIGWLLVPMSFPKLSDSCPGNSTTSNSIHCDLECNSNSMSEFYLCAPWKPSSGGYMLFIGVLCTFFTPAFALAYWKQFDEYIEEAVPGE